MIWCSHKAEGRFINMLFNLWLKKSGCSAVNVYLIYFYTLLDLMYIVFYLVPCWYLQMNFNKTLLFCWNCTNHFYFHMNWFISPTWVLIDLNMTSFSSVVCTFQRYLCSDIFIFICCAGCGVCVSDFLI